jgi:hypothetical protein
VGTGAGGDLPSNHTLTLSRSALFVKAGFAKKRFYLNVFGKSSQEMKFLIQK